MKTNKLFLRKLTNTLQLTIMSGFLTFNVGPLPTDNPNNIPQAFALRVLDFLTALAYPLALFGIIGCAFSLLTSRGNPEAYARSKKNVVFIITGIVLILFANIFFNFMKRVFGAIT